ncbi:MAG: DUF86 domain-containing protein [Elainellaceae cyanobacterium]
MNRDEASLLDINHAAGRIIRFASGLTKQELAVNEEKQSAILYQVIVVGEAAKRLSREFRDSHSIIPWKYIAGMRDILAHQYDRVDINTLWDVVDNDIPELLEMIKPLLPDSKNP